MVSKEVIAKVLAVFFMVILVANFLMVMFRKISTLAFWIVIVVVAVAAFKGIPMLNKK